ncbi:MAG: hypothetical protein IK088_04945 [Lachnospiraceae bacterium]|nr:hypothetical protein [Lachnospiraceae bacterium]
MVEEKTIVKLSAITGVLFAALMYLVLVFVKRASAFWMAIVAGALFAACLVIVLVVYNRGLKKKYAAVEAELTSRVMYIENGNFEYGDGKIRNGNLYFCEDDLVIASFDGKPYFTVKIEKGDISRIEFESGCMTLFTKDNHALLAALPDADEIAEMLKNTGWI